MTLGKGRAAAITKDDIAALADELVVTQMKFSI